MQNDSKEYIIFNNVTPVAITSSTDATPIVVTATAHGFATGDLVLIFGHATNVAANGVYRVTRVSSSTFSLQDKDSNASIAGSGAGAGGGTGFCVAAPKIPFCEDFRNAVIQVATSGTATTTLKVVGSQGVTGTGNCPNIGGTVSATNPWTYLEAVDLLDGSSVPGGTGLVVAGTDIVKNIEVNVNTVKFMTIIPISWTQGAIYARMVLTNNK